MIGLLGDRAKTGHSLVEKDLLGEGAGNPPGEGAWRQSQAAEMAS